MDSFLERAKIELSGNDLPCHLHVPDPQPGDSFLTILLKPAWWQKVGLKPIPVVEYDKRELDHLAVWDRETSLKGLPCADDGDARSVDVYTSGDSLYDGGDIDPGTLLCFQAAGHLRPRLSSAAAILANTTLECQED